MSTVNYYLSGGLSAEQINSIHNKALGILENVGIEVGSSKILSLISECNDLTINKTRVKINPAFVNKHIEIYRREQRQKKADKKKDWLLTTPGFLPTHIVDIDNPSKIRPFTTRDSIKMTKLADSLYSQGVRGAVSGQPQDISSPSLREVYSYKIGCEYSRSPGSVNFTSPETAKYIKEMHKVVGKIFSIPMFILNPMRLEGNEVNIVMENLDDIRSGNIHVGITNMPMLGASAPIFPVGAFVESIAAILGGFCILKIIAPNANAGFNIRVWPFDMKNMCISVGTPEEILLYLIHSQIMEYYSGTQPDRCISMHTNAMLPDSQSDTQRAAFTMIAALNGCRSFGQAGLLGIDNIFSAKQLIIDLEILNHAKRIMKGTEFSETALSYEIIKEIDASGDFLSHETTLSNYRNILHMSEIFTNTTLAQFQSRISTDVDVRVKDFIEEKISTYDFNLDNTQKKELDKIYKHAEKIFTNC